jgi:hypothetical protein
LQVHLYPEPPAASAEDSYPPLADDWQLFAGAVARGGTLHAMLDKDADWRLGRRELRNVAQELLRLDANDDGRLEADETPQTMLLFLGQGPASPFSPYGIVEPRVLDRPTGPTWFAHMDRNGDGDLTLREFIGAPDQFERLDRNADGLIDEKEAREAMLPQ